jgi:hypothetical protein
MWLLTKFAGQYALNMLAYFLGKKFSPVESTHAKHVCHAAKIQAVR